MNLFLTEMQFFTSEDFNIFIVVFLSSVWTLILMAPNHRIHWWESDAMLNLSKYDPMKKQ